MTSHEFSQLRTEQVNAKYAMLDAMSVSELLHAMNENDSEVPIAVAEKLPEIEMAIESIVDRMMRGGRLIYLGAGTSGRLGVLDAAECGPTFSVPEGQVIAFIAGGEVALRKPAEGAEDKIELAVADLQSISVNEIDSVIGIAASGRTPYVLSAIEFAKNAGAFTVALTCNPDSAAGQLADVAIDIDSGPELLAGSTRLKSGTAQKIVLNMLSTITMVRLGKTYGNLMVDLQISNEKLQDRAIRIICKATDVDTTAAKAALIASGYQVKIAILMILLKVDAASAKERLYASSNRIRDALNTQK